ncbi:MAG: hypothetical protein WCP53_13300 [Verrucomicrobiota bacterium]
MTERWCGQGGTGAAAAVIGGFVPFAFAPRFAWGAAVEASSAGFGVCLLFASCRSWRSGG